MSGAKDQILNGKTSCGARRLKRRYADTYSIQLIAARAIRQEIHQEIHVGELGGHLGEEKKNQAKILLARNAERCWEMVPYM